MAIVLIDNCPLSTNTTILLGTGQQYVRCQSFAVYTGATLDSCSFYLSKQAGAGSGNLYGVLYAHSGVYGTSSIATGSTLATSDPIDVQQLSTPFGWITFNFTGANRYILSKDTKYYCIGVDYASSPIVNMGASSVSVHPGNMTRPNTAGTRTNFVAISNYDIFFNVYGDIGSSSISKIDGISQASIFKYTNFSMNSLQKINGVTNN